jgi:hypothetical protein
MTRAVDSTNRIRSALGSTVCLVHHTGKDQAKGARGHSSLRAATDTELEVSDTGGGFFRMRPTKQRDYETSGEYTYALKTVSLGNDEDQEPVTSCVVVPILQGTAQDPKPRGGKVDARQEIMMSCVTRLIESAGVEVPVNVVEQKCGPLPANTSQIGIRRRDARDLFIRSMQDEPGDEARNRASLRRTGDKTFDSLQAAGLIEVNDGYVWVARDAG